MAGDFSLCRKACNEAQCQDGDSKEISPLQSGGRQDRSRTIVYAEFGKNVADMDFHGLLGNSEFGANLFVCETFGKTAVKSFSFQVCVSKWSGRGTGGK